MVALRHLVPRHLRDIRLCTSLRSGRARVRQRLRHAATAERESNEVCRLLAGRHLQREVSSVVVKFHNGKSEAGMTTRTGRPCETREAYETAGQCLEKLLLLQVVADPDRVYRAGQFVDLCRDVP